MAHKYRRPRVVSRNIYERVFADGKKCYHASVVIARSCLYGLMHYNETYWLYDINYESSGLIKGEINKYSYADRDKTLDLLNNAVMKFLSDDMASSVVSNKRVGV